MLVHAHAHFARSSMQGHPRERPVPGVPAEKESPGQANGLGHYENRCTPGRKPSMAGWGLHGRAYASPRFASRVGVSRKSARSEQGVSAEGRRCRQAVVVVVVEELGSCHPWWDDAGEYARWRRPETGPSPLTVDLSDRPQRGY